MVDQADRCKNGKYKPRISTKMRSVIEIMAFHGIGLNEAAEMEGMNIAAARRAFKRPMVRAEYNKMVAELVDGSSQRSFLKIHDLAQNARNERLRFDANRWIAGVGGIGPVQKIEGRVSHSHSFAGFDYGAEDK